MFLKRLEGFCSSECRGMEEEALQVRGRGQAGKHR